MKRGYLICLVLVLFLVSNVYSTEQDLAAYWNFDEGSGDIAGDSSGNGNNGYLGGAGVYVKGKPTWTTGIKNGALSFNGINNYILVDDGIFSAPNPSLDIKADQSFTISVWIKTSASSKYMTLLERYDGMPYHILRVSNNNKASFTIRGVDGGEPSTFGGILLNDGNWHNVVAVRDVVSDKLFIYVDGILETETADTSVGDLGTLAMTFIGMSSDGSYYFEGLMDEYKIYKRALTADEIKKSYDETKPQSQEPIAYWNFDEGTGTIASDSSGNGNTGTLMNNPTWVEGIKGKALSFDGVNDLISAGDSNRFNLADAVTVGVWIKPSSFGTNEYRGIVGILSSSVTDGCGFSYGISSGWGDGKDIRFFLHLIESTDCLNSIATNAILSKDNWYYIVGTYNSLTGLQKIYVNGVLDSSRIIDGNKKIIAPTGSLI